MEQTLGFMSKLEILGNFGFLKLRCPGYCLSLLNMKDFGFVPWLMSVQSFIIQCIFY